MNLSSELISQFAKITNDNKSKKTEEVTLYGEVYEMEETIYVKFDGSEELTPVTTIMEKDETGETTNFKYGAASVKSGDRVSVSLKNHSATITGNLSDPPAGRAEFKVEENAILARVADAELLIDGLSKSITARVKDTEMKIDAMGVTFTNFSAGLEDGTTRINGGCIKTGTIDAKYLNLTGAIKFTDLVDSETVQSDIDSALDAADKAQKAAEDAADQALSAESIADDAYDAAASARSVARSIANGTYLTGTFINGKKISSPEIEGNNIKVYGTFQTIGNDDVDNITTGYMGAAQGMDEHGNITYGVALARTWNSDSYQVSNSYVIVTNAGVRLQYGTNSLTVSENGIWLTTNTSKGYKAYYNDVEIGSGSGSSVTAVWG